MPIFRYFLFVGCALLGLLFVADYALQPQPSVQALATPINEQPQIRIRSDRHLPDLVVLDTSRPEIAAPVIQTAVAAPQPPAPESASEARARDSFAQLRPAVSKSDARLDTKAAEVKTQAQPRRKVAKAHPAPQPGRPMVLAQQPHFGLFGTTW